MGNQFSPVETPWYLGNDYPPGDLVYEEDKGVKAGTLQALVERLTPHINTGRSCYLSCHLCAASLILPDTPFFQCFLLTFRSFTTGDELFDALVERYNLRPPTGLNAAEYQEWKDKKQMPLRLRWVYIGIC
jgi:son of sevenless-like protein